MLQHGGKQIILRQAPVAGQPAAVQVQQPTAVQVQQGQQPATVQVQTQPAALQVQSQPAAAVQVPQGQPAAVQGQQMVVTGTSQQAATAVALQQATVAKPPVLQTIQVRNETLSEFEVEQIWAERDLVELFLLCVLQVGGQRVSLIQAAPTGSAAPGVAVGTPGGVVTAGGVAAQLSTATPQQKILAVQVTSNTRPITKPGTCLL